MPWGVSESAFGDLDIHQTYQYKAFGVPALGLKRQSEEEIVVAPYASLLAVNIAPQETVRNLRRLAGLGLLGDYGYFDAIDFSRRIHRKERRGINIHTYMAHHQSMSFLSLANFLLGNPIQRYFHANPSIARNRAAAPGENSALAAAVYRLLRERASALPAHRGNRADRGAVRYAAYAPAENPAAGPRTLQRHGDQLGRRLQPVGPE